VVTNLILAERFPALDINEVSIGAFVRRIPGIDVAHDKAEALRRLDTVHRAIRVELGMGDWPLVTAEQVHGDRLGIIDGPVSEDRTFAGCDGLITNQHQVALGIYVADCCAVYLVDPVREAVGLIHSGKKGSELGIVGAALDQMRERFGSQMREMIVQLSPCIRPPHYEIDFAASIVEQCRARGVMQIHDDGVCTACDLESFYSYRAEKGKTGRMLALLGLK
ncbi:MAG: purine-nucleoside/S-methyl-5-thioadenosine phosphorylase / adenosine deaminase, partial [Verrucomicrobiota bacterium]